MRRSGGRTWAAGAVLALALAGCGSGSDGDSDGGGESTPGEGGSDVGDTSAEAVAEEARGYIDELASSLGADAEVKQDTLTDCVPGDSDSGKELVYAVQVTSEGGKEAVLSRVSREWEGRGWTVEPGSGTDLRLSKDTFSMALTVSETSGRAAIVGGGGCTG